MLLFNSHWKMINKCQPLVSSNLATSPSTSTSKMMIVSTEQPNLSLPLNFYRNLSLMLLHHMCYGSRSILDILVMPDQVAPRLPLLDLRRLKKKMVEMIKVTHPEHLHPTLVNPIKTSTIGIQATYLDFNTFLY